MTNGTACLDNVLFYVAEDLLEIPEFLEVFTCPAMYVLHDAGKYFQDARANEFFWLKLLICVVRGNEMCKDAQEHYKKLPVVMKKPCDDWAHSKAGRRS